MIKKGFNNYLSNILLITLFNGLIWGQKEYNVENLILNGDSFIKKFSEEIVNGSIFIMMGDIKVVLGRMRNGKKYDKWVYWWDNGLIKSEGSYNLGKRYGEWAYYNSLGIKDSIVITIVALRMVYTQPTMVMGKRKNMVIIIMD